MEEIFESSVLDDLFTIRSDGFECLFLKKYGKQEELEQSDPLHDKLENLIKQIVKDESKKKEILKLLDDFSMALIGEMCFWNEQFYKLGFTDAHGLKIDIKNNKNNFCLDENKDFFQLYEDIFLDYFEKYKSKYLHNRKDYIDIVNKIENIKQKYPKVREFVENEQWQELSSEEQKAFWEVKGLDSTLEVLEIEEAFKLGLKDNELILDNVEKSKKM